MIVTELIFFTIAAMFGVLLYWRESKNNYLYRMVNSITHAKNSQMKPSDRKGFLFQQPFLIRLVVVALSFLVAALIIKYLTPIPFMFELFATSVVGTIVGTYFASLIVVANEKLDHSQETIDESIEKGKDFIKDLTEDVTKKAKEIKNKIEDTFDGEDEPVIKKEKSASKEETTKKSGRDRLKDKGLL